jgi:thiol-disulfide isomerase/thioredoxin
MKKILTIVGVLFFLTEINAQTIPKWKVTVLEEYINKSETPVIINFWATYCIPCIKELPYFEELVKKYEDKGVKLLLVSLDFKEAYPEKIKKFSAKMKFSSSIVWLNETNADYFCPKVDSKWSGVMPASLFVNNKTGHRSFFEEAIPKAKLEEEIIKMIGQ